MVPFLPLVADSGSAELEVSYFYETWRFITVSTFAPRWTALHISLQLKTLFIEDLFYNCNVGEPG
jgi:hypothetical protein